MTRSPSDTDHRHKPVPVPRKGVKRGVAKSRNVVRGGRRIGSSVSGWFGAKTEWIGGGEMCRYAGCHEFVLYRRMEEHEFRHEAMEHKKRKVLKPGERDTMLEQKARERPVLPRTPSPAKTQATKPPARSAPVTHTTGANVTASTRPRSGNSGAKIAGAFQAWASVNIETVAQLKEHLAGMDAGLAQAVEAVHSFAAEQIVGKKIDPRVAAHIDGAADTLAAMKHQFTQAWLIFESIYGARLEYERNQRHKPNEQLFKDVG
jgi:hypothetical protein